MLGVFALVIGPISDKIGRRKIILLGTGAMSLALFLHYFAFDYFSMMTVRAVAGCAGGMLTGSTVSYVGDYFPTNGAVGQTAGSLPEWRPAAFWASRWARCWRSGSGFADRLHFLP
ncbi:MAG: MFS transporter [Calditrichia bacterium]